MEATTALIGLQDKRVIEALIKALRSDENAKVREDTIFPIMIRMGEESIEHRFSPSVYVS